MVWEIKHGRRYRMRQVSHTHTDIITDWCKYCNRVYYVQYIVSSCGTKWTDWTAKYSILNSFSYLTLPSWLFFLSFYSIVHIFICITILWCIKFSVIRLTNRDRENRQIEASVWLWRLLQESSHQLIFCLSRNKTIIREWRTSTSKSDREYSDKAIIMYHVSLHRLAYLLWREETSISHAYSSFS